MFCLLKMLYCSAYLIYVNIYIYIHMYMLTRLYHTFSAHINNHLYIHPLPISCLPPHRPHGRPWAPRRRQWPIMALRFGRPPSSSLHRRPQALWRPRWPNVVRAAPPGPNSVDNIIQSGIDYLCQCDGPGPWHGHRQSLGKTITWPNNTGIATYLFI